jgi:hypothetical protein
VGFELLVLLFKGAVMGIGGVLGRRLYDAERRRRDRRRSAHAEKPR